NGKPYSEIVTDANQEFPGLNVKMHHCREIVLAMSAHVSLTIEDKHEIIRLRDEENKSWKQIADKYNIRSKRAQAIYRGNKEKIENYRKACLGTKATAKVISIHCLSNLTCIFA